MGILSRVRERSEAFVARRLQGEALSFSAEIPGRERPLWAFKFEAAAEPEGSGERLRVRAHFQLSLRRPAALPPPGNGGARPALPARVGRWIERRLESRLLQDLAAPLLDRDLHSWIDVRSSSAALDEGSNALVPERLGELGITPQRGRPFQTWAGGLTGPRPGFATLTLLQLDKEQLPAPVREALGPEPFHLTATLVNVVEET